MESTKPTTPVNQAFLNRFIKTPFFTIGKLQIFDEQNNLAFECHTMELAFKENHSLTSCIPSGIYQVKLHESPKFGICYKVQNVPNREHILFHIGNYPTDTHGCVLVGTRFTFSSILNKSSIQDSRNAFNGLMALDMASFQLKISESC